MPRPAADLHFNRRQLDRVLRVYVGHYNNHRPHRALDLRPPTRLGEPAAVAAAPPAIPTIYCRDLLGGLLHEYEAAA